MTQIQIDQEVIKKCQEVVQQQTTVQPQQTEQTNIFSSSQYQQQETEEYEWQKNLDQLIEDIDENAEKFTPKSRQETRGEYDAYIANLQAAGVKTTGLRENEVNFAEYGAALSEELKQEILNSFDCEADYILQQEILALFQNDNDIKNADFATVLRKLGYEVSRETVRTSYIIDDKKSKAHGGGTLTEGGITVFTITDPQTGAEIKIADTNGNGAIEAEEVIMNQFLEGVSQYIDTSNFGRFNSSGITITRSDGRSFNLDGTLAFLSEEQREENKAKMEKDKDGKNYRTLLNELTEQYLLEIEQRDTAAQRTERRFRSSFDRYTPEERMEALQKAQKYIEYNYKFE